MRKAPLLLSWVVLVFFCGVVLFMAGNIVLAIIKEL